VEDSKAVAAGELQDLRLDSCKFDDEEIFPMVSVGEGRDPKQLSFQPSLQDSSAERVIAFVTALRGNMHLERLRLWHIGVRGGIPQALASALGSKTEDLFTLALRKFFWVKGVSTIFATHPSLRSPDYDYIDDDQREALCRTKGSRGHAARQASD
jgi:hypothetical protein